MVCQQGQHRRQDIYTLIHANQAVQAVQAMCKHRQVCSSAFYDWCRCTPSQRSTDDQVMTQRVRQIHQMSDCTYGRHRVRAELVDMGEVVKLKRIERLMRLAGLHGISRRRGWCVTTRRDTSQRAAPDLVRLYLLGCGD